MDETYVGTLEVRFFAASQEEAEQVMQLVARELRAASEPLNLDLGVTFEGVRVVDE